MERENRYRQADSLHPLDPFYMLCNIMDSVLNKLLVLPILGGGVDEDPRDYDKGMKGVVSQLKALPARAIIRGLHKPGDVLVNLEPDVQSVPYLFALSAHINAVGTTDAIPSLSKFEPSSELWRLMEVFMVSFNPMQMRYAGKEFRCLIEKIIQTAYVLNAPAIAIRPVKNAILRIDPSGATFTSSHVKFVRLCLQAKAPGEALAVIDRPIWNFPMATEPSESTAHPGLLPCSLHETSSTYVTVPSGLTDKLTYQDCLQYYLYGAMVYMMGKHWEAALGFLETILEWPANAVSMIQVKAYEKWVLVGLLQNGKPLVIPSNVKGPHAKDLRALCKPYDTLAEIYKQGDRARLEAEVRAGMNIWQMGCNKGLVDQVVDSLRYHAIKNLGKMYMSLPLDLVARETARTSPHPNDVAETRRYVQAMIDKRQLNASITPTGFLWIARSGWEGPLARSEAGHLKDLAGARESVKAASLQIEAADRKLSLAPAYQAEVRKTRKVKGKDFEGPGPSEAEDMLADL